MEVSEVRQKAKELKTVIEDALRKFRDETGYAAKVEVLTKSRQTNEKVLTNQQVTVTVEL